MKKLIYLITVVVLVFNFSCKDSGTGPEEKKSVRDYTWTADTLAYPGSSQTLMRSIWGSSTNNIYVCGHNSNNEGSLWHYNGNKWRDIKLFDFISRSPYELYSVAGTLSNDVWVVGYRLTGDNPNPPPQSFHQSLILHYNGTTWKEENVKTKSAVFSVYANAENDVWACGEGGIVYHFDGSKWGMDTIKISVPSNSEYNLYSITKTLNTVQILGALSENFGAKTTYYLFELKSDGWSKADSFIIDSQNSQWKWGVNHLYATSFGKLYSVGFGIFERIENDWKTILSQNFASFRGFYELGKDNMIGVGDGGEVYNFNGNDWMLIERLKNTNILYTGVRIFDDEAFIIGYTLTGFPQKTVVLHGK
ncbi:MAG: hypothetical protein F9K45_01170 [Melioribacteraceae bacterium]|nr:MAG: hypothetical protein F9K45_01170 [Melioribacteraceae bacterium]